MKPRHFICLVFTVLLSLSSLELKAQDYECITTDPATGQITINWDWITIYPQIDHYEILYGLTINSWIDSVGVINSGPSMSFTLPLANGNTDKYYIIIRAVSGVPGILREISLSNIFLTVTPNTSSIAVLNWNSPVYYSILPYPCNFVIQRFQNSVWHTLAIKPYQLSMPLTYSDTLTTPFCNVSAVNYRVQFQNTGITCLSTSNIASGSFYDNTQPSNPSNDTISIYNDPSGVNPGRPVIGWTASPEADVAGYIIYRYDGTQFNSIDTIPGDSTIFIDKTVFGCQQTYEYALAAIDSCGNTSYGTFMLAPHSIVLNLMPISSCEKKANLSWNAYDNMPGGLAGYIVYRQVNTGAFVAVDTVGPAVTAFTDSILFINGNSYSYYVRAISAAGPGSSSSCAATSMYYGPVVPDTLYTEQVSVINNSYIEAKYYYSPANRIKQLRLDRADSPAGPFVPVDTLTATGNGFLPQEGTLTDLTAHPQQQSYVYRLVLIDSCKQAAMYSENLSTSIFLSCNTSGLNYNILDWNDYGTWYQGVDRYEIYRLIDGVPSPAGPLAVISSPPLTYSDDTQSLSPIVQACYYIKAVEKPGNPVVTDAFSESNLACAYRDAIFFMPTAFSPSGLNNRYRPVKAFVDQSGFNMQIYNKWGQMIFETADMQNGWDGNVNGAEAPADVYIYRVSYKSLLGDSHEKRGAFTLVR